MELIFVIFFLFILIYRTRKKNPELSTKFSDEKYIIGILFVKKTIHKYCYNIHIKYIHIHINKWFLQKNNNNPDSKNHIIKKKKPKEKDEKHTRSRVNFSLG